MTSRSSVFLADAGPVLLGLTCSDMLCSVHPFLVLCATRGFRSGLPMKLTFIDDGVACSNGLDDPFRATQGNCVKTT